MRSTAAAALLAVSLLAAACTSSGGRPSGSAGGVRIAPGTLLVVAGPNTWGDVAAQIGGTAVTVHSILSDPNKDPHEYSSSASDAAAVEHARLVITNGLGYDDFMTRLLSTSRPAGRRVLVAADVVGVRGNSANPHLWYSTPYVDRVATAIEQELAVLAPARAGEFAANLRSFLAAEAAVASVLQQIAATYGGTKVGYTERVPGYLLQEARLVVGSPSSFARAVEEGDDPSPLAAAVFDRELSDHVLRVLIYNSQVTDPVTDHVRSVAAEHGVAVVGMSETVPQGAAGFAAWQLAQAQALLRALGG